jgi:hypothetical protein
MRTPAVSSPDFVLLLILMLLVDFNNQASKSRSTGTSTTFRTWAGNLKAPPLILIGGIFRGPLVLPTAAPPRMKMYIPLLGGVEGVGCPEPERPTPEG